VHTEQLTDFLCFIFGSCHDQYTHTHTYFAVIHAMLWLCGPKDRLWQSIMAMIYSVRIFFLRFSLGIFVSMTKSNAFSMLHFHANAQQQQEPLQQQWWNIKVDYNKESRTKRLNNKSKI